MFVPLSEIVGLVVQATDKPAGKVADLLFDDVTWDIRHVVVADAGGVAIQPASVDPARIDRVDRKGRKLEIGLTQEEIAGGPDESIDPPVSRSHTAMSDPDLRSLDEVTGYKVFASDGEVGTLADLIAGEDDWKVHLVVVETRGKKGGKVLVGAGLVDRFDHASRSAHVEIDAARFAKSPPYDPKQPIRRLEDVKLVGQEGI
jgi:hypothetical protein